MDVYQKLLIKLYEQAGGKESEQVDFTDLVKREGFYPSLPDIYERFLSQIWITQGSGKNVKLTHWGVQEAKKLKTSSPETASENHRETNRLIAETKEFLQLIEEFSTESTKENFDRAAKKFSDLNSAVENLKSTVK